MVPFNREVPMNARGMLDMFEIIGEIGTDPLAIDISPVSTHTYRVSVGVKNNDNSFRKIAGSTPHAIRPGATLEDIAKKELEPFGTNEKVFNVYIREKLYREGIQ